jgi:hypothetical protein
MKTRWQQFICWIKYGHFYEVIYRRSNDYIKYKCTGCGKINTYHYPSTYGWYRSPPMNNNLVGWYAEANND